MIPCNHGAGTVPTDYVIGVYARMTGLIPGCDFHGIYLLELGIGGPGVRDRAGIEHLCLGLAVDLDPEVCDMEEVSSVCLDSER